MKTFTMDKYGFSGEFHKDQNNSREKAMIALGGSMGTRRAWRPLADLFVKYGFDTMIVDYHGEKGLPRDLKDQPVEVVEKAAIWLKKNGYEKIGVYGISLGTTIAVLAAVHFPELISCMVLVSPMYMVTQAEKRNDSGVLTGSSFAIYGRPFPYAKWNMTSLQFNLAYYRACFKHKDLYCKNILEQAYENNDDPYAVLPVQKARAHVLFISGAFDSMIPADETSRRFMKILDENNYPYVHKHINYEHLGHAIVPFDMPLLKIMQSERMYPKEGKIEKKEAHKETIRFMKKDWKEMY